MFPISDVPRPTQTLCGGSGHSENGQTIIAVSVSLLYEQNRRCRSVTSEAGGWRPACPLPAESLGQTLRQLVHRGQPVPTPRPRSAAGRGQSEACSCRVCVATPVTSLTPLMLVFCSSGFTILQCCSRRAGRRCLVCMQQLTAATPSCHSCSTVGTADNTHNPHFIV